MKQVIRCFIAIDLPKELKNKLQEQSDQLRRQAPSGSVRWSRIESIHLTLKFLGDVLLTNLPAIKAALARICQQQAPFEFAASDLGCFPNPKRPRVVWVGVQETSGRLTALQRQIEKAMKPLGYPPEKRRFHPHLTLGRVKQQANRSDAGRLGQIIANSDIGILARVQAHSVHLFRSDLRPSGAVYTSLAAFEFSQQEA